MKVFSNVEYISFCTLSKSLSRPRDANSPPRSSSQFGPQWILSIFLPVSTEAGRAVGGVSDERRLLQMFVVERERLVVFVDGGQVEVREQVREHLCSFAALARLDLAASRCASSRLASLSWFSHSFG